MYHSSIILYINICIYSETSTDINSTVAMLQTVAYMHYLNIDKYVQHDLHSIT
jgi:hypothetical protein